jgi:DNA end-binding protein Ku
LRYADELVDTAQMEFPPGEKVRKAELDMAKMLIENLAAEWDPSKYTDEYRDNLMKLIKARIKGEKPRLPSAEPAPEGKVVDLMERLRQSLAQNQKPAARTKPAKRSRPAAKGSGRKKTRHAA